MEEEEEEEEEEDRPVDVLLLLFLEQTSIFVIDTVFKIIYLEKYYYCCSILFLWREFLNKDSVCA